MSKREYKFFIEDIIKAINKIEDYTKGFTYEEFINEDLRMDAVIRNLEIIGEAAKYIPEDVKDKYSEIPWKRMIGLRNIVVHEYFGIDTSIIWNIATINLHEVKPVLRQVLSEIV